MRETKVQNICLRNAKKKILKIGISIYETNDLKKIFKKINTADSPFKVRYRKTLLIYNFKSHYL